MWGSPEEAERNENTVHDPSIKVKNTVLVVDGVHRKVTLGA
jgi:hypothetical protein